MVVLGIEQSTLQWIIIAYGLMLGGFLLLGGRMADLLGRRRGAPTAAIAFPRRTTQELELEPAPPLDSIVLEPTEGV